MKIRCSLLREMEKYEYHKIPNSADEMGYVSCCNILLRNSIVCISVSIDCECWPCRIMENSASRGNFVCCCWGCWVGSGVAWKFICTRRKYQKWLLCNGLTPLRYCRITCSESSCAVPPRKLTICKLKLELKIRYSSAYYLSNKFMNFSNLQISTQNFA